MKDNTKNTAAWRFQSWGSFLLSVGATAVGIAYLPVDGWTQAFMAMGLLFTVGSCFSLAKTIRDDHEATRMVNRITEAKAERILREFELEDAAPVRSAA